MSKYYKYLIISLAYLAVLFPLGVRIKNIPWTWDSSLSLSIFPLFGLAAFSLLWLHAISGVFEPWLRRHFNFDRFIQITASIILVCIILHPLLLILSPSVTLQNLIQHGGLYLWLGIIGWLLLITYDIGKFFKKHSSYFVRNWNKILTISTIGFLLAFFHSIYLGSDLQIGFLRYLWIFYGVTAILATIWTYGINRDALNK